MGGNCDHALRRVVLADPIDAGALLGQVVAKLQSFRPPEPYKGKGVRLVRQGKTGLLPDDMEKIRTKAGKAGKGGK